MHGILEFLLNKKILNILIYFLGLFALKGASFILIPLYTATFTTSEYGTIELANSIVSFMSIIVGMGLCQYLGIEYFHYLGEEREKAILTNIKQYLIIAISISVVMLIAILLNIIRIDGLSKNMMVLIVFVSFMAYFSNLCLMLCKNQQKTTMMTILQFTTGVVTLLMNYCGVCLWGWGIYSTLITTIISHMVLAFAIPKVYKFYTKLSNININLYEMKRILIISIPLALTGLINCILIICDRWFLNYYCSTSEIGIYSIATKFAGIYELVVVHTLTIFYSPIVYKSFQNIGIVKYETKNRKRLYIYFLASMIAILCFLFLVTLIYPILINSRYNDSLKYIWIILVGEMFLGATYFRTYLINYEKKTKCILLIIVVGTIFNVVMNIIFIPYFQIYAAAVTTATSQILMFLIATVINRIEYQKLCVKIVKNVEK